MSVSSSLSVELQQRVEKLLQELSIEEKVALMHGRFLSGGVPRLEIPPLEVADGPVGIRLPMCKTEPKSDADDEVEDLEPADGQPKRATALPGTLLLAATWNRETARRFAGVIASEMLATQKHVLLAPGINLMRDPRGGRNYEYFGEDPYLTAEMAIGYVRGLQERGVGANLKHYVANECDKDRHFTSSNLDDHVLREVYAYPFERAIREADAWTVMTGNNLCNGLHVSESRELLTEVLRNSIGFDGVILTDWRSAYQPEPSIQAGLDMTTGFCEYVYGDGRLLELFRSGNLPIGMLEETARRILTLYAKTGVLTPSHRLRGEIDSESHREAARTIAAEGMVLLKNRDGLLPLRDARKIVVTGPGAEAAEMGTGSGLVNDGIGNCSPIQGLRRTFGEAVMHSDVAAVVPDETLEAADLVIFCAKAVRGGEGRDLESIELPDGQAEAIQELRRRTERLLVLLQTGGPVDTSRWDHSADALLVAWYGGQAAGDAMGDVISGKVNPSGKLPCVFGNPIQDYPGYRQRTWPAHLVLDEHPGKPGHKPEERKQIYALAADYTEGLLIGHRWFDHESMEMRYPFGFGLSYTQFRLENLSIEDTDSGWMVECDLVNEGECVGAEVVQLYVGSPEEVENRPVRQLRGFEKVTLEPGASTRVHMRLRRGDLARFDSESGGWVLDAGSYAVRVGSSSADLPLEGVIEVKASIAELNPSV